ncbi:ABC transporter substrate-binding protein [Lutibaculum baratangense]|uniref:Oligopeptide ABC transporter, periplasmic oligopeptide-binding protein OppA n=1 Tax=Lutibaculum baratangense AMV1 TaxID=631454 RepID=V4REE7_9HYPH|nr:ABC transporter substrate-binding protein [Lutibaculum baratangense]ESR23764.1 Oligopeptide ABC transporter, periplasmic oligopeptide-binding protein OppA [Lutibaculum baratangense AMV1]
MVWKAGLIGAIAVAAAFAAPVDAQAKDVLTIDLVNEPSSLDPHGQWNPDSYYVYRNVFDNMVTRDNDGEIVPQVAESWERLSDTEVQFNLRDDITFHDGEPLTAEDVVYSVERITDPEFASPQLGQFDKIVKAEAKDDQTVVLTTDGPYPVLLPQLVKLSIVPKHVVEEVGAEEFNLKPVGSGPYVFEEWRRGVQVTLTRNEDYWGDKGAFATAVFRAVPDAATRLADLQSGAADLVVTLDSDQARQLETYPNAKPLIVQTERVGYFAMNSTKAPLDDVRIRRAIALAIDKEGIVEGILAGGEQVVGELVSPAHFGWVGDIEPFSYDPEEAKSLIAEVGEAAKTPMKLATSPVFDQKIVQAIQQMLTEVGLNVEIEMTDMATWLRNQQVSNEEAPMLTFSRWSCACQDADGIMFPLLRSGQSWSRWSSDEVDALLDRGRSSLDEAERLEAYGALHELVKEEVPLIPLYQAAIIYGGNEALEWMPTANESMFLNRMGWSE